MLEELQRRNFSPSTIRYYIRTVRDFAAYFHKSPDVLGVEEVRQFQLHMLGSEAGNRNCREPHDCSPFLFQESPQTVRSRVYDMQLTRVPKRRFPLCSARKRSRS